MYIFKLNFDFENFLLISLCIFIKIKIYQKFKEFEEKRYETILINKKQIKKIKIMR